MGYDRVLESYQLRADTIFRKGEMAHFNVYVDLTSVPATIIEGNPCRSCSAHN